jgi:hypothetical protein
VVHCQQPCSHVTIIGQAAKGGRRHTEAPSHIGEVSRSRQPRNKLSSDWLQLQGGR